MCSSSFTKEDYFQQSHEALYGATEKRLAETGMDKFHGTKHELVQNVSLNSDKAVIAKPEGLNL